MQDYDALRARVEETAKRMKEAQSQRTRGSQSLVEILGALESKFAAQEEELAFYRDRVGPLEHTNARLTELIGKLLELVDTGFGEDSLEPMRRATAMAAAMLDKDMAPPAPAEAALDTPGRFEDVDAERLAADAATVEEALDTPGRFEDVGPERLAADAATAQDDLETLPDFVRRALVERQSEAFESAVGRNAAAAEAARDDGPAEIGMIGPAADEVEIVEEAVAAIAGPVPHPKTAETAESVGALATALDRKSAAGEPLEAGDISTLLERVEALANQPDDDDIDIPPAHDEGRKRAPSQRPVRAEKTGTHG